MTILECKDKDCPFCKVGIPRRVTVPIYDLQTGESSYFLMSEEVYDRIYKLKHNPKRKEVVAAELV